MQNLVIVESPTKARTLERFLGGGYQIEASMGHVRDLPKSELGIEIEKNFEPLYIIPRAKKKRVNELKKIASSAKVLWLATDPDREGEAIAWHLTQIIGNRKSDVGKNTIHRVVFHEITPKAIKEAFEHPREINYQLVDAQQARRVLDRIVGYKLSPLLWKKIKRGLSAGRVQSILLRLIVEREKEIEAFKEKEYWTIEAELKANEKESFIATVIEKDGKKIEISNEAQAKEHVTNLEKAKYLVSKIDQREVKRYPSPPFTTSTLQQAAGNKLRLTAKKTMMLSQNLYERGYITYMRTDSVTIAQSALTQTRDLIYGKFGKDYLPSSPRFFKSKVKNVQEAHEAIRPTDLRRQSSDIQSQGGFTRHHVRLYDLIWKRMVASQMREATLEQTSVDVAAEQYSLRANGSVIKFPGWLKLYGIGQDVIAKKQDTSTDEEDGSQNKNQILPELRERENLKLLQLLPNQHFTQPPPRYAEASLIKKLEELGIGRPSTYAPILSTIQDRIYVERLERKFKPTFLGIAVNDFLLKYFSSLFDYSFTAKMEDELDEISRGERTWRETVGEFYSPFEGTLEKVEDQAERVKIKLEEVDKNCPDCGKKLVVRISKFGKFLACSGFPDCKHTESFEEKINAKCPEDRGDILVRKTKKGKIFYGCSNWPKCKFASWTKPKLDTK